MDDARIKQLTEDVLAQVRGPGAREPSGLEARVSALEAAVRALQAGGGSRSGTQPSAQGLTHASLQILKVDGGADRCIIEPDQPCTSSGQCRSLGH
jgi:hypothetical protein